MRVVRTAEPLLRRLAASFPVTVVTGPRQSGKTTLVRQCFPQLPYASLEEPDQREFATQDARGFLAQFPRGAVLDEVQRCSDLLSYLQGIVDRDPRSGRFILTGSQQFDLLAGVTQSLAGRVGMLTLLPFSAEELASEGRLAASPEGALFAGGYPPIHDRGLEPSVWLANYVATYVERDVRRLINVRDLSSFQRFLRLCAGRSGQLLNLSALATDAGITHNTARAWISVLEASWLVRLLPPHHRNFNKRLVKTAKLFFLDAGLAAWLLGIRDAATLRIHPLRGPLFETWVLGELWKARFNRGLSDGLFFWRDSAGHEVDVIREDGDQLDAIEIKSGTTLNADFFQGLERWRTLAGKAASGTSLIYGGNQAQARNAIQVVPWSRAGEVASGG